jgi:NTP pyrophosphatase (non-canonical NTP hydrolase)
MEMMYDWCRATDEVVDVFFPRPEITRLRLRLLREEYEETRAELLKLIENPAGGNRPELAKELADMLYVIYGTGTSLGLDLDEAFWRVHHSNMSKVVDGKVTRDSGGKILKPASYEPPYMDDFGYVDSTGEYA